MTYASLFPLTVLLFTRCARPTNALYSSSIRQLNIYMYHSVLGKRPWASAKNWGGRLHGGGAWIVQLSLCKCPPWSEASWQALLNWPLVVASPVLGFLAKWGQHGNRESCILLENGPTQSLVARASQFSPLAACKFPTVSEERCTWVYHWCFINLTTGFSGAWNWLEWLQLQSMWAQTVNFWVTTQECMVGGYTEDLKTTELSKSRGGCLPGTIWYMQIHAHTLKRALWWEHNSINWFGAGVTQGRQCICSHLVTDLAFWSSALHFTAMQRMRKV